MAFFVPVIFLFFLHVIIRITDNFLSESLKKSKKNCSFTLNRDENLILTMISLRQITQHIGVSSSDTNEQKMLKSSLVVVSILIAIVGVMWSFMYLLLGLFETALIPCFYSIVVIISLIYFNYKKNYNLLVYTQLVLILILPYIIQLILGGIIASGFVMIWGILTPIGSLLFLKSKNSIFWFVSYLVLTILFIYFDDLIAITFSKPLQPWVPGMFLSMNIVVSSIIIFLSILYYLNAKNKEELKNEKLLSEVQIAKKKIEVQNILLEKSLEERGILLKEIHHRVKNNLQVITSLLSLQSNYITEEKTKALLRYSQYRIQSMAIIHEMLYHSKDLSKIQYGEYLNLLTRHLVSSMKGSDNHVKVNIDAPSIFLNIDTAIPLGLMINEIITNSLKYGLPRDTEGNITIKIQKNKTPYYTLFIGDDGVGFPDDINFRKSDSLGILLMHNLALQLKGNIEKEKGKGTHYIVSFQEISQTS